MARVLLCIVAALALAAIASAQLDCINNPSDPLCENFTFPDSEGRVDWFCTAMHNMPTCTILDTCKLPAYNVSDGVCTYFSLLQDLCADMPGMDRPTCNNLTSMCQPNSTVAQCRTKNLVETLPTFMTTRQRTSTICTVDSPSKELCDPCTTTQYKCDLIGTYANLCALNTTRAECAEAITFCESVAYAKWPVCKKLLDVLYPSPPGELDCPRDNKNLACVDYRIANPAGVLKEMCDMMDNMPACSVSKRVCKNSKWSKSQYCTPDALMAQVCTDMTMGVQGCVDYEAMCTPGTVVKQCSEPSLKHTMPDFSTAKRYVQDICTSMPMSECKGCTTSCDYLTTYSELCISMPDMKQCQRWKDYCKVVPDWPYCSSTVAGIPEMRMYFHTGFLDYVLFKTWVPRNGVQYAFTWIAIFVAGVLLEALKFLRGHLERRWAEKAMRYDINSGGDASGKPAPWSWKVDIPRSILATLELCWGYFLMLIAMTFNVGLFIAVLVGCLVGTLIFGRFLAALPKAKVSSCH